MASRSRTRSQTTDPTPGPELPATDAFSSYWVDALQRSVLFMDTLLDRGNAYREHLDQGTPPLLKFDHELVLDGATYRVSYQGQSLKLGPTEFKLLHFFMKHAERVHSRGQLLDKVWGDHVFIEERTVDVHVKRLRESLGDAGAMVETVRGAGYRLTAQPVRA